MIETASIKFASLSESTFLSLLAHVSFAHQTHSLYDYSVATSRSRPLYAAYEGIDDKDKGMQESRDNIFLAGGRLITRETQM